MPIDQIEQTEGYLKVAEQNLESSFKMVGRLIYKVFYLVAGAVEPVVGIFMPKEDQKDEPF